jgi:hypothetical protein
VLAGGAAAIGLLAVLSLAATRRPAWYRPASVDHARLRADKWDLAALLDKIGAALNTGRPVTFELHADQVQRWIVARGEIWPETIVDLGPIRDTVVVFEEGGFRVGAEVAGGSLRAVLSLNGRVEVDGSRLRLTYGSVRLGAVPVPRSWVNGVIARIRPPASADLRVGQDGAIGLRNEWVWPNGRRRYRIAGVAVSEGVARVTLEPLVSR